MHAVTQRGLRARPAPYAQVELLLLFHPRLQATGPRKIPGETCAAAT